MKKAISIWSFKNQDNIKECLELAKDAGFDGIELSLNGTGELGLETTEEKLIELRNYANSIGLKIHSLASGLYWDYSFTSDNEEERKKAFDIACCQIKTANILGADSVLIVPGAVGVDFIPERQPVNYEIAYSRALEAFLRLKSVAEEYKIHVGIENVWNKFLLSPLEMRDFIDKIDSFYVGAYFDVGNVVYCGYPEQWIEILGKRIKKVHFKDYKRAAGGLHGFVDLLSGDVDWAKVMEAFEKVGYDGWCTAEMIPCYTYHSEQIIYNTSNSMNKIYGR